MKKWRGIKWVAFTAAVCVVLSGCQAVGGVDLNTTIEHDVKAASFEGEQTIRIELLQDANTQSGGSGKTMAVTIEIPTVRKQDAQHFSMKGAISVGERKVPFIMSLQKDELSLEVAGASHPVVFHLTASLSEQLTDKFGVDLSRVLGDPDLLLRLIVPQVASHMDNPTDISAEAGTEIIHGESVTGSTVRLSLRGGELSGLLKDTLTSLAGDDKAVDDFSKQVYAALNPEHVTVNPDGSIDVSGFGKLIASLIKTAVSGQLNELAANPDALFGSDPAKRLLSDSTTMTATLFVDEQLRTRKASAELTIKQPIPQLPDAKGIKLTLSASLWNIGGSNIKADTVDTSKTILDMGKGKKLAHFVGTLGRNSDAYGLLMDDFHILRKKIVLPVGKELPDNTAAEPVPYIEPGAEGRTMVPLRYVTEQLDADVSWNDKSWQATVVDALTGKTIVFTIGSTTAIVDGEPVAINGQAVLNGDFTYVPVAFVAEQFGAHVDWDDAAWTVTIQRN